MSRLNGYSFIHRPALNRYPKAVLFDWDDTLFDHESFANILAEELIQKLAPDSGLTGKALNEEWHKNKEAVCRQYFPSHTTDSILKIWENLYAEVTAEQLSLLSGARDLLKNLKSRGIRIGIVSNKSREFVVKELNHFGLFDDFEVVVGKHQDKEKRKPSYHPIAEAVKQMNLSLGDIYFVGDSDDDMQAARACRQRFHIHHSQERRHFIQVKNDHGNDETGSIIQLDNLYQFNEIINKMPVATRSL